MREMRKLLICLAILCLTIPAFSADAIYERTRPREVVGWRTHSYDTDIDLSPELVTLLGYTYAQHASEGTIEIYLSTPDTATETFTIVGIDDSGKRISEEVEMYGMSRTTGATTSTFRYFEGVSVNAEVASQVTIRSAVGGTYITTIPTGDVVSTIAQHFSGEKHTYITGWDCGLWGKTTGNVLFQLRLYPDDADCLDNTDGFEIVDRMNIIATPPCVDGSKIFAQPIKVASNSYVAIFASSDTINTVVYTTMQGFDVAR